MTSSRQAVQLRRLDRELLSERGTVLDREFDARIWPGPPVHEVMRPADEPSVIAAGAMVIDAIGELSRRLAANRHAIVGSESVFVGQVSENMKNYVLGDTKCYEAELGR